MLTSILPAQGKQPFPSPESFYQRGTSPLNIVYTGAVNQTALTTVSTTRDFLRGYPIVIGDAVAVDALYVEATAVAANAVGRVGIYRNESDSVMYPSSLVVESGEVALETAVVRSASVSARLSPGCYWLICLTGVADPTLRGIVPGGFSHLMGMTSAFALNTLIRAGQAYGAMPASFPAGGTFLTAGNVAAVGLHFAS